MCPHPDDDEPAKPQIYKRIQSAPADLTEVSLEEAAVQGGVPHFHTLIVGPALRIYAASLARKLNATQLGNPLCPYINVQVEPRFGNAEWCLVTPAGAFGSTGY